MPQTKEQRRRGAYERLVRRHKNTLSHIESPKGRSYEGTRESDERLLAWCRIHAERERREIEVLRSCLGIVTDQD